RAWTRDGRLTVLNVGATHTPGEMPFYVNKDISEWSSFDEKVASRGHAVDVVIVKTVTPAQLFDTFGSPYFLKVDIEGFDHLVVQAAAALPTPPRYISFENGAPPVFEKLAAAGYTHFKLVNQRTVPELASANPAREGLAIKHKFPFGSSGPF